MNCLFTTKRKGIFSGVRSAKQESHAERTPNNIPFETAVRHYLIANLRRKMSSILGNSGL
ncbi:hypothetical protein IH824_11780 [candidate division KSB1 bacterium]|nr:hypothetical protein [candidate division KSB1 bacterium]